jgi:penicillin-binding protein 2
MKIKDTFLILIALLLPIQTEAQVLQLPNDGPLTLRPLLQQLGTQLLEGKKGSIVAIQPENGEIICLATHNENDSADARLAIAKAYAPGSTIKTAQALILYSEGLIDEHTSIACDNGFLDGNIKVGCHKHRSPLKLKDALAQSCNTWFISTFMSMINDNFLYENADEAITVWRNYMRSMGLGGPLGIDMHGELGGLLANANYLKQRYPDGWTGKTILWAGMGQGDITLTPLQMCNLAVTLANRGYYYPPHIHQATEQHTLSQRYLTRRDTKVIPKAYKPVIAGMRRAVESGTAASINTPAYQICGKTGTIENAGKDHSAFIGFAPMNNPKIAIAVYIEHGGFGADLAAPIASLIMEQYLKGKLSKTSQAKAKQLRAIHTVEAQQ